MEARAAAFRYTTLPVICPKCHASGPALTYDRRAMHCLMCGKDCYLAPEQDREIWPLETPAERGQRMAHAAQARLRKMTPQQIHAQMEKVRQAKSTA